MKGDTETVRSFEVTKKKEAAWKGSSGMNSLEKVSPGYFREFFIAKN